MTGSLRCPHVAQVVCKDQIGVREGHAIAPGKFFIHQPVELLAHLFHVRCCQDIHSGQALSQFFGLFQPVFAGEPNVTKV